MSRALWGNSPGLTLAAVMLVVTLAGVRVAQAQSLSVLVKGASTTSGHSFATGPGGFSGGPPRPPPHDGPAPYEPVRPPQSLRDALFGDRHDDGRTHSPPLARYAVENGPSFVLDQTVEPPLLKFDNSIEVWALEPQAAPRGDVIFKNDLGEPVLRVTRLGGLTVFTDQRPDGSAAAAVGDSAPLRLPPIGPDIVLQRLAQASARASRAAQRLIPIEAEAGPESGGLVADAAMVSAEAVVRISHRNDGKSLISRIVKIVIDEGKKPLAALHEGVIKITVAPALGVAGRPSSERIAYAIGAR